MCWKCVIFRRVVDVFYLEPLLSCWIGWTHFCVMWDLTGANWFWFLTVSMYVKKFSHSVLLIESFDVLPALGKVTRLPDLSGEIWLSKSCCSVLGRYLTWYWPGCSVGSWCWLSESLTVNQFVCFCLSPVVKVVVLFILSLHLVVW